MAQILYLKALDVFLTEIPPTTPTADKRAILRIKYDTELEHNSPILVDPGNGHPVLFSASYEQLFLFSHKIRQELKMTQLERLLDRVFPPSESIPLKPSVLDASKTRHALWVKVFEIEELSEAPSIRLVIRHNGRSEGMYSDYVVCRQLLLQFSNYLRWWLAPSQDY